MAIAIILHLLPAVIWVGGMFFAYMALRPVAASQLEPPARLSLWVGVFRKFFPWVFVSIALILASGLWMVYAVFGGFAATGLYVHVMLVLGILMMLIFFHVFFAPYMRLRRALKEDNYQVAGENLNQIRKFVGINLLLGLLTIITAVGFEHIPV